MLQEIKSVAMRWVPGLAVAAALFGQAPTTQVPPLRFQALAQETAKARENFGVAWDSWTTSNPGLESKLTTYTNLTDLKTQVKETRQKRMAVDSTKAEYFQASRKELLALNSVVQGMETRTADPNASLKALDLQYQAVKQRRDQIAEEIANAAQKKDILLGTALKQEQAILEKLSVRLRDEQDAMQLLKTNVTTENKTSKDEKDSFARLLQYYDDASRASAEVGAAYQRYYDKMEEYVDSRIVKAGAGGGITSAQGGGRPAGAGGGVPASSAGSGRLASSGASAGGGVPAIGGGASTAGGGRATGTAGGGTTPPVAPPQHASGRGGNPAAMSPLAKLAAASGTLRFDTQESIPRAALALTGKPHDKAAGTLTLTQRLDTNTYPAVLELNLTASADGQIQGTWKEKGGKGKGKIEIKPGTRSVEVQILDPSGQTQLRPSVLVFWYED